MTNERIEAEATVPASSSISVTTVAQSATTVTATAGATFLTALLSNLQTQLNNSSQGYPTTAAAMTAATWAGTTWSAGWLCNETSGSLAAVFGSPSLTAVSSPTYLNAGPRSGVDFAVGFDSANDAFNGGDVYDATATDDLIIGLVLKVDTVVGNTDILGKGFAPGYLLARESSNLVWFCNDGVDATNPSVGLSAGVWYAVICALDRANNLSRIGICDIGGTPSVSTSANSTLVGNISNANNLVLGADAVYNISGGHKIAAFYIGTGVGVAGSIVANLSTAVQNFARAVAASWTVSLASPGQVSIGWTGYSTPTWSLSWTSTALRDFLGFTADITNVTTTQTGTLCASGVWFPGCNFVADSDPLQAPTGDDRASAITPTGRVYSIASSTYFRHRNCRFPMVARNRAWANSATVNGEDWETFYLETQIGQHSWFEVGSRVMVFWDNAGSATELGNGDVEAWRMPNCIKLDELQFASGNWTGLVVVPLGDLFADQ